VRSAHRNPGSQWNAVSGAQSAPYKPQNPGNEWIAAAGAQDTPHKWQGVMAETLPVGVQRVWDEFGLLFDNESDLDGPVFGPANDRFTPEVIDATFACG
jgi:hypothetical protein